MVIKNIYTSPAYAGLVTAIALHVEGLNQIGNFLAEIAMANEGVLPRGFCAKLATDARVSRAYISQLVANYGFGVANSNGNRRKADKRSSAKTVSHNETNNKTSAVDLTTELFGCLSALKKSGLSLDEVVEIVRANW